jgi:diguanylate cyclase (GGDEF)-like protein
MRRQSSDFAFTVLDALTAHIAVLDEHGVIVGVNRAWRRFAEENGGECGSYYVGQNYLAVCEAAVSSHDGIAGALLEGLQAVLHGGQESFAVEYPCDAPDRQRWFVARITRCQHQGHDCVVVAHEDITSRKHAEQQLQLAMEREQLAAHTDELTGLFNRRHFFSIAAPLFESARRYGRPLSVAMLDLDHFKRVNDRYGHQVGDLCLRHLAVIASGHLRAADQLARYGGEEFVLLLPDTDARQAYSLTERIRSAVASSTVNGEQGVIRLTLSAGIAGIDAADENIEQLIRRADLALYAAKAAGRNRSRMHSAAVAGLSELSGLQPARQS